MPSLKGNDWIDWFRYAKEDKEEAIDRFSHRKWREACYHSQQAIEKLLKAYLTSINVRTGKTHDIAFLLNLCVEKDRDFESLPIEELSKLTFYAVEIRYPDEFYFPSVEEAENAIKLVEEVKNFVVKKLKEKGYKL